MVGENCKLSSDLHRGTHKINKCMKPSKSKSSGLEMAQQVGAFAALAENRIDSQHPQWGSQTSVTTTSGDPSPPSGLHRLCTQSAHTHIQTLSDIIIVIITIIESFKTSLLNNVFVSCLLTSPSSPPRSGRDRCCEATQENSAE